MLCYIHLLNLNPLPTLELVVNSVINGSECLTLLPPPPALLIASVSTFCDWFHENHCNRSTCINHFLQQCFFISKLRIRIKKIYEFRFRPSIVSHKPLTRARYRYNPHNWAISIDGFNPSSNNFQLFFELKELHSRRDTVPCKIFKHTRKWKIVGCCLPRK